MRKNWWKIVAIGLLITFNIMLVAQPLFAQQDEFQGVQFDPNGNIKKATNLPDKSPVDITIRVIQWALGFLGLVAVIMIIWGGFTWMTSAGNEEKVRKAKDILRTAIIGLIVVLLSWALVTFVVQQSSDFAS